MLVRRVRESNKVPRMRLDFISYCRLLPPREIAKSFSANGMIGRGGGDRTCALLLANQRVAPTETWFDIAEGLSPEAH